MSYRNSFAENLQQLRSKKRAEYEDSVAREEQEKQRKDEEARMPVIAAQAEQNKIRVAIREAEKQEVLAGRKDPSFVLPEHMKNARMNLEDAKEFMCKEADKFRDTCEEFRQFNTPENRELLFTYLQNQGVNLADADTFREAFFRLRDLGLFLNEREPEPVPAAQSEPQQPTVNLSIERQSAPQSVKYIGIDGHEYTEREVYRMSSTELKQTFGLYGPRLPKFSNVIPA